DRNFLEGRHIWRRDVGPVLATIGSEMDLAIVRAGPDAINVQRRRRHRINHAALNGLSSLLAAIFADARRDFKRFAREVRTDLLPASSTSRSLPQRVGSKVKSVLIDRREHDWLSAQHAKILLAKCLGQDVLCLGRATSVARK